MIIILKLKEILINDTSINNWGNFLTHHSVDERFIQFKYWLSDREQVKIDRIKNPLSQAESVASRVLAKSLINHYYLKRSIVDYRKIEIVNKSEGERAGSPEIYVENKKIPLEVTMTHSYGNVAVWLCTNRIGIDIEKKFWKKESSFIKSIFTSAEIRRIFYTNSDKTIEENLTVLWCIKESIGKLLKCGLQFNPQIIQVLMNENQTVDIHFDQRLERYFHLFRNKELRLNIELNDEFCSCKSILLYRR